MTFEQALEFITPESRRAAYRWLCSDFNPDIAQREGYRRIVMQLADPASQAVALIQSSGITETPKRGCCG
jgi:hypothetical protein